jgi:hypothetical protein
MIDPSHPSGGPWQTAGLCWRGPPPRESTPVAHRSFHAVSQQTTRATRPLLACEAIPPRSETSSAPSRISLSGRSPCRAVSATSPSHSRIWRGSFRLSSASSNASRSSSRQPSQSRVQRTIKAHFSRFRSPLAVTIASTPVVLPVVRRHKRTRLARSGISSWVRRPVRRAHADTEADDRQRRVRRLLLGSIGDGRASGPSVVEGRRRADQQIRRQRRTDSATGDLMSRPSRGP